VPHTSVLCSCGISNERAIKVGPAAPSLRSGFRPSTSLRAGSAGSRFAHARKAAQLRRARSLRSLALPQDDNLSEVRLTEDDCLLYNSLT
jgi:hypothetical protein